MKNVLFPRFSDEGLWTKIALGIILMFVPIANLLAFGYLYHFLKNPRYTTDGGIRLDQWGNWIKLFTGGVRLILFLATYVCVACGLSIAGQWLFFLGSVGHLYAHWFRLFPFFLAILQPLLLTALFVYQKRERLRDMLNVARCAHYLRYIWWPMLWPALGFVGLQTVCGALYGIAWFAGFGIVFASFNELLRHFGERIEETGKS
ncbi:MAG: hypothetical protein LBI69_04485 [Puniceicoccales bacterium]|jgi:hypothetical protein|nr:hypothetical protein [Puniceicoccales bacterium]